MATALVGTMARGCKMAGARPAGPFNGGRLGVKCDGGMRSLRSLARYTWGLLVLVTRIHSE